MSQASRPIPLLHAMVKRALDDNLHEFRIARDSAALASSPIAWQRSGARDQRTIHRESLALLAWAHRLGEPQ